MRQVWGSTWSYIVYPVVYPVIYLFIYSFIYLLIYLLIYFVRKPNFLSLLNPLKMNSSEFWGIFEIARYCLSCFNGQILLEAGM